MSKIADFVENVLNYFSGEYTVGSTNVTTIKELGSGDFALLSPAGKTIQTYARHRDARRGARRRGLSVA